MTNSYLIDSNILLRISRRDDPDYQIVDGALERLLRDDTELYYTHQNIAEFWNVWTRPADKNGFGLTGETAEREIGKSDGMMKLAGDSVPIYERWPSALARNDPGLLTKTDPGSPPPAGMIMPYLPSVCGPRPGPSRWVNLSEHKWVSSGERRGAGDS